MSASATTGPENPLKVYTEEERAQITQAEQNSLAAYSAFKDAQKNGSPKEEVDQLKEEAMRKDEELKSLQDLCD